MLRWFLVFGDKVLKCLFYVELFVFWLFFGLSLIVGMYKRKKNIFFFLKNYRIWFDR